MNEVAISNDPKVQTLREQLEQRLGTFAEALPAHITPAQFKATLIRAAMSDPGLLVADRVSFFEAALAAAIDGLMPDKKEGAMVVYNTKIKENGKEIWIKKVQWLPMIRGIFTKVYNTGLVKSATVGIVYGGDEFRTWTDDEGEHLQYEAADQQDRQIVRRYFAQVVMKEGGCFVEEMWPQDIEKVKGSSKTAGSGPWVDWYEEMAKKTVFKRLAKRLPISRDLERVLSRDDFLYDLANQARDITPAGQRPRGLANRLDALAGITDQSGSQMPMEKIGEKEKQPAGRKESARKQPDQRQQRDDRRDENRDRTDDQQDQIGDRQSPDQQDDPQAAEAAAFRAGRDARSKGMSRKALPADFKKNEQLTAAWLEGFDAEGE